MPMSLQQLIKLYILQKEHHQNPEEIHKKKEFELEFNTLLADVEISKEDYMAPPLFDGQPSIPFVLFKPKAADPSHPKPLIIHTHGGPAVYMDKNQPHAEIAYLLSQGYVVACPNFRGSTGYPDIGNDKENWILWQENSKNKHHLYGPEDVYTVTKHLLEKPYVDGKKVFLRGGSYGSFINAHLLEDVKKGKFENIFKGVHLSAGLKYPIPSALPEEVSYLITHSEKDLISPFADAKIFMEKMLLRQLNAERKGKAVNTIQTFVATQGNHHLIDPSLEPGDQLSLSYQELARYLELTTSFIDSLSRGEHYQPETSYQQYRAIMGIPADSLETSQLSRTILSYNYAKKPSKWPYTREKREIIPVLQRVQDTENTHKGPSMSLLKLQLGAQFTGDIRTDLTTFLRDHFAPISWKTREKLEDAGKMILQNTHFVDQLVEMLNKEESFVKQNPDYLVLYHSAENNVLQLYCFINFWLQMLQGDPSTELPNLKEMRLFDFMKKSFDDIKIFLIKMRKAKAEDNCFNYTPGFSERATACNPALTSNPHSTASCSLWWYYNLGNKNNENAPTEAIAGDLLRVLGIYSPERLARYTHLFDREQERLLNKPQGLMQQVFLPYSLAERSAYLCQIWGEEFNENELSLDSPKVIKSLIAEPELFEQTLRKNKTAFTNFGDCQGFGDTDNGFNYASTLQVRYLSKSDPRIVTNTYTRSEKLYAQFVAELRQLIVEDYADYLACGSSVPDFIVQGADKVKQTVFTGKKLRLFAQPTSVNDEPYYLQQLELNRNLVQNPAKETFGGIIALDSKRKAHLQDRIRETTNKHIPSRIHLYSLCIYLRGYTYYDLLKEAATEILLNNPAAPPQALPVLQDNYNFLMKMIDTFSIPSSIETAKLPGNGYLRLSDLMRILRRHEFDPDKHQMLQPSEGICYEHKLWSIDFDLAVECVLRHARLAKEKGYGHDVNDRQMALY